MKFFFKCIFIIYYLIFGNAYASTLRKIKVVGEYSPAKNESSESIKNNLQALLWKNVITESLKIMQLDSTLFWDAYNKKLKQDTDNYYALKNDLAPFILGAKQEIKVVSNESPILHRMEMESVVDFSALGRYYYSRVQKVDPKKFTHLYVINEMHFANTYGDFKLKFEEAIKDKILSWMREIKIWELDITKILFVKNDVEVVEKNALVLKMNINIEKKFDYQCDLSWSLYDWDTKKVMGTWDSPHLNSSNESVLGDLLLKNLTPVLLEQSSIVLNFPEYNQYEEFLVKKTNSMAEVFQLIEQIQKNGLSKHCKAEIIEWNYPNIKIGVSYHGTKELLAEWLKSIDWGKIEVANDGPLSFTKI